MNTTDRAAQEADRYLAALREHLGDLTEEQARDVLEDLPQHLREVAAEAEGPLDKRLGSPATYADELRASAGLPLGAGAERRPAADAAERGGIRAAWRGLLGDPRVRSVRRQLREPAMAWWLARGYLLAVGWDVLTTSQRGTWQFPIPLLSLGRGVALTVTVAAMSASVALGRRRADGRMRRADAVLTALMLLVIVPALQEIQSVGRSMHAMLMQEQEHAGHTLALDGGLVRPDGTLIGNLYPYDEQGRPLEGVLLYDQDGRPVEIVLDRTPEGHSVVTSYPVDRSGRPVTNSYPQHQGVRGGGGGEDSSWGKRPSPEVPELVTGSPEAAEPPIE